MIKKEESIKISGRLVATLRDIKTGKIKERKIYKNLNPTVMKTMIANNLTDSSPDNNMLVNYGAVGTDGTSPAVGDTTLTAELERTPIASLSNVDNVAQITAFFNENQGNGTLLEAGIFSDATSTTNSGILVSHVNINITKSSAESLTLDWQITIS